MGRAGSDPFDLPAGACSNFRTPLEARKFSHYEYPSLCVRLHPMMTLDLQTTPWLSIIGATTVLTIPRESTALYARTSPIFNRV
jgi:hypothetical protein